MPTREALKGKANLHRIPTNGGPTTKGLAEIDKWIGNTKWDLIHFNWGLHDLKFMGPNGENLFPKEKGGKVQVPIDQYAANLDKLTARLKKTGAKLIWRNTTPIPSGSKGRYPGDSVRFNEAAAKVMKKHGIPTQDLFTVSKKRMNELMLPANALQKGRLRTLRQACRPTHPRRTCKVANGWEIEHTQSWFQITKLENQLKRTMLNRFECRAFCQRQI